MRSLSLLFIFVASSVAQDICSSNGVVSITSQENADEYAGCDSFSGTISIDQAYSGSLSMDNLESIGGIKITGAQGLTSVSFKNLQIASGVSFTDLVNLSTLDLSSLKNVTSQFVITGNNQDLGVELPNLAGVGLLHITNASSIDLPNLTDVLALGGQLVISDGSFTSLTLPKLRWTRESFWVKNNPNLVDVSFPALTTVGQGANSGSARGTIIVSGQSIKSISFESLEDVESGVYLHGNFSKIDFPKLSSFGMGTIVLATESEDFDCASQEAELKTQGLSCVLCGSALPSFNTPQDGDINIDGGLIGGIVEDLWNYGSDICGTTDPKLWGGKTDTSSSSSSTSPSSSTSALSSTLSTLSTTSTVATSTVATSTSATWSSITFASTTSTNTASTSAISPSVTSTSTTSANATFTNTTSTNTPIPYVVSTGDSSSLRNGANAALALGFAAIFVLF